MVRPSDRPLYSGLVSFAAQSVAVLMIAGGLFRATGGVFTRRKHQEEWILDNVKDVLCELLDCASSVKVCYVLLGLEVVAELGKMLQGHACVCVVLMVWSGWLLLRDRVLFVAK
ncbi:hypothetical protein DQ04_04591000 [Trypanosoma grayi]|uniref:hypothetical protein n=1 Tax=Trypanosoma grayi TaxID=71804 RepID=UPI0004F46546|nr:hypothetical protein DQ04_04591000 [Trypanosoma grayi]KEG09811.1 hypothetical protein DQ04_04591000 [Trypanosoma grayi]